jgi:hypothetical protein
MAVPRT